VSLRIVDAQFNPEPSARRRSPKELGRRQHWPMTASFEPEAPVRLPRPTTRRLMVVVAVAGIAMGAAVWMEADGPLSSLERIPR
jgi:hypothetical protein